MSGTSGFGAAVLLGCLLQQSKWCTLVPCHRNRPWRRRGARAPFTSRTRRLQYCKRNRKGHTLGSYQNELGASEIHALFFQPAR